ncbi:hypothetical protein Tco_0021749, partial [Tanacetum coccineum]
VETPDSISKPAVNEPTTVSKLKVWSDAPIIEEYELDSNDEYVIEPSKEQEKPSFAFVNTVKHVKIPRETVKEQNTFSHLIRDYDFHEKRMAKQVELNKKKGKGTGQGENRSMVVIGDPKYITGTNSPNTMVDQILENDNPQRA